MKHSTTRQSAPSIGPARRANHKIAEEGVSRSVAAAPIFCPVDSMRSATGTADLGYPIPANDHGSSARMSIRPYPRLFHSLLKSKRQNLRSRNGDEAASPFCLYRITAELSLEL